MRSFFVLLLCLSSLMLVFGSPPCMYTPFKGPVDDSFDWRLAKRVLQKHDGNTIVSPIAIKALLQILLDASDFSSMAYEELNRVLFKNEGTRNAYFKNIIKSTQMPSNFNKRFERNDYDFRLNLKMFCDKVIPSQIFVSQNQETYGDFFHAINFTDPHQATEIINGWATNVTDGYINHIIKEDSFSKPDMVGILVNALYFRGLWEHTFFRQRSEDCPFYVTATEQVTATFMHRKNDYYYADSEELNAQILRIPYLGQKYSMMIVLPKTQDGLDDLIRNIDGDKFRVAKEKLQVHGMEILRIPKFKFEYLADDLVSTLKEFLINDIFKKDHVFRLLGHGNEHINALPLLSQGGTNFFVSDIIQKAGVEIDEDGDYVEATEIIPEKNPLRPEMDANHPFLFFIEDDTTGMMIFAGKVINPNKS